MSEAVDTWTEADGTGVEVASVCPYLATVSLGLIDSPETDRADLLQLCEERALQVDAGASKAALRARLVAFNLSSRSVWCSRAQLLAKHVCKDVLLGRDHLLPFQAAIAHRVPGSAVIEASPLISSPPPTVPWASLPFPTLPFSVSAGAAPAGSSLPAVGGIPSPDGALSPSPGVLSPSLPPSAAFDDQHDVPRSPAGQSSSPTPRSVSPSEPGPPDTPSPQTTAGSRPPPTSLPPAALRSSPSPRPPSSPLPPPSVLASPRTVATALPPAFPHDHGAFAVPSGAGHAGPAQIALQLAQSLHQQETRKDQHAAAVSKGFSTLHKAMSELGDTHQAASFSTTAQLSRMEQTLVNIERARVVGVVQRARSPPAVTLARAKRQKRGTARALALVVQDTLPDPVRPALLTEHGGAAPVGSPAGAPFINLVHGRVMEPELLCDTMGTAALCKQLTYIIKLAHVSPGEPSIFGSYVVKRLHAVAKARVEKDAASRGVPSDVNEEKATRIDNIIANKADIYIRVLRWVHSVLPHKLGAPASDATMEKMRTEEVTANDKEKLEAAMHEEATFLAKVGVKMPSKMMYSSLRKMISKLAGRDRAVTKVDLILSMSPFKERLAEATRLIGTSYLEPTARPE